MISFSSGLGLAQTNILRGRFVAIFAGILAVGFLVTGSYFYGEAQEKALGGFLILMMFASLFLSFFLSRYLGAI